MMGRRDLLRRAAGALALAVAGRGAAAAAEPPASADFTPLVRSHEEWRKLLSPAQFDVLFREGTEPPGSSQLDREKRPCSYLCAACYLPLFSSQAKFDSGTGWPSFFEPLEGHLGTRRDFKLVIPRTEYHCARCGGHQGHVFKDGPPPTGLRYCNNGVALRFVPQGEPLPELRS
jgi:peptide-methionine (R)-S-oxide reductase